MNRLVNALTNVQRLGLDTAPFVYFIEAHPKYDAIVVEIFQRIANGQLIGITSVITLVEVLVMPVRMSQSHLVQAYRDLLQKSANLEMVLIDVAIAEKVVELRARYNLRTPDALQIAAALQHGCDAFLTNDIDLKRVTELRVLVLDELL